MTLRRVREWPIRGLLGSFAGLPAVDTLKLRLLKVCHNAPTAGHLGQEKTLELLSRNYYWLRMRAFVNDYVRTCDACAHNKTSRHAPYGPLQPLPVPPGSWNSVSMDFIVELPPSDSLDAIYVCVDRFTKMTHFIPTKTTITAKRTVQLFYQYIWKHHCLPADIVSDRGPQFVAKFTRKLLDRLGVQENRSTAFHPQSDGQTESVNQTLEQYLHIYCDYHQDDWVQLLPLAEFVYNNTQSGSTRVSPFFTNYGYHPRCTVTVATGSANPAAEDFADKLKAVHEELALQLKVVQGRYKLRFDRHATPTPPLSVGDKVWLSRRNIKTKQPLWKLNVRRLGPFCILEAVGSGNLVFRLELLASMGRIHPVYHVSLLEPYRASSWADRLQELPHLWKWRGNWSTRCVRSWTLRWRGGTKYV